MSTKVKGLLKGFRYISQIFDEKEEQFQIGLPTDVKHVAHIGSDDPSANAPSWMNEFKGGKETPSANPNQEGEREKSSRGSKTRNHLIPKSRHQSIDTEGQAPKPKTTRRHQRSSDPSADSSNQDSSTGGSRHRRTRRGSNHGADSPSSQEMPPAGAKSSRRKSKNLEEGSVKKSSGRSSKGDSLTDISISDFGSGPESGPLAAQ